MLVFLSIHRGGGKGKGVVVIVVAAVTGEILT
jgi:hypothetical protein